MTDCCGAWSGVAAGRFQPKATEASARSGAVVASGLSGAVGLGAGACCAGGKALRLVLLRRSCPLSCSSCNRLLKGGAVVLGGLGPAALWNVGSELEERCGGRGGSGAPGCGSGGGATGSDPELSLPGAGKRLPGRCRPGRSPSTGRTRKSARQFGQRIFAPGSAMSASGASTDSRQAGQRSFIGGRAESAVAVRSRQSRPQVIAPVPKRRRFAPLDTRTKVGEETTGFKLHDQTCRGRLRTRTA